MIKRTPYTLFELDRSNVPSFELHVIGRKKLILIQKSSIVMIPVFLIFEEGCIIQLDFEFQEIENALALGNVIVFEDMKWVEEKSIKSG